jgi:hypothetical protein
MRSIFIVSFISIFLFIGQITAGTKFYRASYRDDPSTTIVISWCDNGTSTNASVYYGTTDFGGNHTSYPLTHGIDRTVSHEGQTHRHARLTNLIPNTIYYFVIKDDQGVSQRMSFKTLSDNPNDPLMFISGGDTRTGIAIFEFETSECIPRRQRGNQLVAKIRPDFVASSGDYVFDGDNDSQWSDWFSDWQLTIGGLDNRIIPIVPVFGNHEDADDIEKMFDVPNNNVYYAISFGGNLLRFYNLNSDLECNTTMLNWLSSDLQAYTGTSAETYWKAVQFHIPLVPHGEYSPMTTLISCWAPLFTTYDVRLAMEGHTHVMKWTYPIVPSTASGSDNGFIREDTSGTVYIGEGTWGAPLRNLYTYHNSEKAFNWTRNQVKTSGFFVVTVTKQKMEIKSILFNDASQVAGVGQVQPNDPQGTLPSGLTFWNPSNGSTVEILSNHNFNNDASLMSLQSSLGSLSPTFSSGTTSYQCLLPAGTTTIPSVTAIPTDANAVVNITDAINLNGTQNDRTTYILVTAEDGTTTMIYSVEFIVGQSISSLSNLSSSIGSVYPVFHQDSLNYKVFIPYGTTNLPVLTATPTDPNAVVNITQTTTVDGNGEVEVISFDQQDTTDYNVDFILSADTAKEIIYFSLPNQISSNINPIKDSIIVYMPLGSSLLSLIPNVIHNGVSIVPTTTTAQDFDTIVEYTVTAGDNSTKKYVVKTIITNSNSDAGLIHLSSNVGILNPLFDPAITNYQCNFSTYPNLVSVDAIARNPAATVKIFLPLNVTGNLAERTANILVIAPDGVTTKLYKIIYSSLTNTESEDIKALTNIWPNPTNNYYNVRLPESISSYDYFLVNGLGHIVLSEENQSEAFFTIDASHLSKGAYYLLIKTHNPYDVFSFKLIKN